MLREHMERYVELKRSLGYQYETHYRDLKNFVALAEARGERFVRAESAIDYASRAPSLKRRYARLIFIRGFALAMHAEDPRHEVPRADVLGRVNPARPKPYIYTPQEIIRLITAARQLRPAGSIKPLTYSTLFGLLAATGMRVSEALALRLEDITEDGLIVRQTKFKKSRLLPLHRTTTQALNDYISVRNELGRLSGDLFISITGKAPAYPTVERIFRLLSYAIGLRKESDRSGPRIHDLRHTFAVRSLEQCERTKEAVGRHIVALSTYLGHASIANTYWYLEATPRLMKQIAEAGEAFYQGDAA